MYSVKLFELNVIVDIMLKKVLFIFIVIIINYSANNLKVSQDQNLNVLDFCLITVIRIVSFCYKCCGISHSQIEFCGSMLNALLFTHSHPHNICQNTRGEQPNGINNLAWVLPGAL